MMLPGPEVLWLLLCVPFGLLCYWHIRMGQRCDRRDERIAELEAEVGKAEQKKEELVNLWTSRINKLSGQRKEEKHNLCGRLQSAKDRKETFKQEIQTVLDRY